MKIAAKEADETEYWLTLCKLSQHYPNPEHLINDLEEIIRIITKIIASSKR
jgi:four helix bundle protein